MEELEKFLDWYEARYGAKAIPTIGRGKVSVMFYWGIKDCRIKDLGSLREEVKRAEAIAEE